ncbi:MAG: pentapeptide repeat-containing protein [Bacilli bacterium]|nr:pentapeptide repeat-containing protein [Bacilli bacterium]
MPAKLTRDKLLKLAEKEIEYPYGHWNNIESTSQCVIEKKEITDIDLSWKDISWTTFSQCIIKNVNFKNAILKHVRFKNCVVEHCSFESADLCASDFKDSVVTYCNFDYAALIDAKLQNAKEKRKNTSRNVIFFVYQRDEVSIKDLIPQIERFNKSSYKTYRFEYMNIVGDDSDINLDLKRTMFNRCYFQGLRFKTLRLSQCRFDGCTIGDIRMMGHGLLRSTFCQNVFNYCTFRNINISSLYSEYNEYSYSSLEAMNIKELDIREDQINMAVAKTFTLGTTHIRHSIFSNVSLQTFIVDYLQLTTACTVSNFEIDHLEITKGRFDDASYYNVYVDYEKYEDISYVGCHTHLTVNKQESTKGLYENDDLSGELVVKPASSFGSSMHVNERLPADSLKFISYRNSFMDNCVLLENINKGFDVAGSTVKNTNFEGKFFVESDFMHTKFEGNVSFKGAVFYKCRIDKTKDVFKDAIIVDSLEELFKEKLIDILDDKKNNDSTHQRYREFYEYLKKNYSTSTIQAEATARAYKKSLIKSKISDIDD